MSKKEDELIIYSLANRWVQASNPAAGATCTGQIAALTKAQHNVTSMSYSLVNMTAAAVTVALSIRDASIGGNVLARWNFVQAAASGSQGTFANLDMPGIMSNAVVFEFGTPQSSVTQTGSMIGWTEAERSG